MATLPVYRMGADVLKHRAVEVPDATDEGVLELADSMLETMLAEHGVGLAAPQVGVPLRIVMFFVPGQRNRGVEIPLTIMVNPVIEPLTSDQAEDWEGCLSVPGLTGRVPRWTTIRYSFTDLQGKHHEREAHDYHARVVQHECDHLDGVLYPMRMTDISTLAFTEVLQKQAEQAGKDLEFDEEGVPVE